MQASGYDRLGAKKPSTSSRFHMPSVHPLAGSIINPNTEAYEADWPVSRRRKVPVWPLPEDTPRSRSFSVLCRRADGKQELKSGNERFEAPTGNAALIWRHPMGL